MSKKIYPFDKLNEEFLNNEDVSQIYWDDEATYMMVILDRDCKFYVADNIVDSYIPKYNDLGYTIAKTKSAYKILFNKNPDNPIHYVQPIFKYYLDKNGESDIVQETYQIVDGYYKDTLKDKNIKSENIIYYCLAIIYINITRKEDNYNIDKFKDDIINDNNIYNIEYDLIDKYLNEIEDDFK